MKRSLQRRDQPSVGETKPSSEPRHKENSLTDLGAEAKACKACDLWKNATQTVFGEGTESAEVVFIGEQPGDREDIEGRPFVGPAGKVFNSALDEAGIDRTKVYITNAVKHFKWTPAPRGKRRIHQKPNELEIAACLPWLEAELRIVKPAIVVCLGATAAQSVLGKSFRLMRQHGEILSSPLARAVKATIHPSAVLRTPDEASRRSQMALLVGDLKKVSNVLSHGSHTPGGRNHRQSPLR